MTESEIAALPKLRMTAVHARKVLNGKKTKTIRTERSQMTSGLYRLELNGKPVAVVRVENLGQTRWDFLSGHERLSLAKDEGGYSIEAFEHLLRNFRIFKSYPYRGFIDNGEPRWLHKLDVISTVEEAQDNG